MNMVSVFGKIDKRLVIIISLSFFASLFYSFWYKIQPAVDARAYDSIAQNIINGNGFREEAEGDVLFDRSIQRAGPAYEYFLAGIYTIFGHQYEAVWIIQAILHALSAWLIWLIGKKIFFKDGETIGLIAATIFGLHPDLIEISAMLLTETFYLFLTILILYCFVEVYFSKKWLWTVALVISLAIGILARPPILLFVPIIVFWYITKKQLKQFMLFGVLLVLCLIPWTVRNYTIYHQFIPTTLIGEYNLWVGNTLTADGGQLSSGYNPFDEYVTEHGYVTLHVAANTAFKNFISEHPGRFIELTAIRTIRYFSLIRPMGFWFYETGIPQLIFVGLSGIAIAFLFITGFTGMIKLAQKRNDLFYYVIVLALTAPVVLLPTVVQSRYRFQIYPFLALSAGYAIYIWIKEKNWLRDRSLLVTIVFLGAVSSLDLFLNMEKVWMRFGSLF
jgi:4-amino-4-deoxy-L-arabinose transferase-like glycosyltransferase